MSPRRDTKESGFSKALADTILGFCKCTSLNGFKLLYTLRNLKIQRLIWSMVILHSIGFAIYVVIFAWNSFTYNPTITTLESQQHPIWKIPFPAISVCSANKISKDAVEAYAKILFEKSRGLLSTDAILKRLELLAGIYDTSSVSPDEASDFHYFLDRFDSKNENEFYNVKDALYNLAPKCDDIIRKCRWATEELPCADIFHSVATPEGFCCIFNYLEHSKLRSFTHTLYPNATGFKSGLTILLNTSTADYFYKRRSFDGIIVQVFNQQNFPDETTGSLKEIIVPPENDVFLKLLVTNLKSDEDIRSYTVAKRKCLFADENYETFGEHYSYSDCLTKCKLRSIEALCNCVPYYAPLNFINESNVFTYCSLSHLACLERYRVTWNTYRPLTDGVEGLEREMEDSLNCPDCLPLCSDTKYDFQMTMAQILPGVSYKKDMDFLSNTTDLKDLSVLKIYYATGKSMLFKKDLLYTWYEIVGNFGGLLGICIGCSIIGFVEFLYFATVKLYENFMKLRHNNRVNDISIVQSMKNKLLCSKKEGTLYPYTE